jgi:hypothetical protein
MLVRISLYNPVEESIGIIGKNLEVPAHVTHKKHVVKIVKQDTQHFRTSILLYIHNVKKIFEKYKFRQFGLLCNVDETFLCE